MVIIEFDAVELCQTIASRFSSPNFLLSFGQATPFGLPIDLAEAQNRRFFAFFETNPEAGSHRSDQRSSSSETTRSESIPKQTERTIYYYTKAILMDPMQAPQGSHDAQGP
jgi:hypothetical protein